jgi:hypothetical protein
MAQTQTEEKKPATETVKRPEPPEGFISFDDFIDQNPKFCEKYEKNKEAHMAIWLDEPVPGVVQVSRRIPDENGDVPDGGIGEVQAISIPNRTTYTIAVSDFINWFGDPRMRLHLKRAPAENITGFKDTHWKIVRSEKLRLWCRDLSMRPSQDKPTFMTPLRRIAESNDQYGLWDSYPKVFILLPTQMIMATTPTKDLVDFVWESMNAQGINMTKKKFDENDTKAVQNDLLAKAKEYKIEGVFGMNATGTIIEGYMMAAKEKYVK